MSYTVRQTGGGIYDILNGSQDLLDGILGRCGVLQCDLLSVGSGVPHRMLYRSRVKTV